VNVQVIPRTGSFEQVKCVIDFGDKSFASVCNPPSHTYGTVGTYTLKAEITNYCGTTILRSMPIHVLEKAVTFSTASAASVAPAAVHVDPTQGIESFSLAQSSRSGSLVGAVIKVIDGDTFDVLLGSGADSFVQRRVRFASINAPELKGKTDQEIFYAKKAKEFLTGLILNKKIELQFDSKLKKYDRYGRLLAHVYSSRQDPIEDAMLQSGMAKVFTTASDQNSHYLALQSQAQTEKKGMWSDTYLVGGQPIDASGALESFIPAEDTQDSFITEAAALQTLSRSSKSKSSSSHAASSKAKKTVAKKVGIKKVSAKKSSSSKSPSAVVACMSGSMLSAELGDVSGSGSTPLILLIPLSAIVGWLLGMFFKRVKSG
jgi:endonuclease YncB( thermonuclease family)